MSPIRKIRKNRSPVLGQVDAEPGEDETRRGEPDRRNDERRETGSPTSSALHESA